MYRHIAAAVIAIFALLVAPRAASAADDRLIVHEWGTFTALQDESGRALAGINIDDETLPLFVHNLNPLAYTRSPVRFASKGAPERHPLVTLRLETPVIYFYPPQGQSTPFEIDVEVRFHGGWLTEFYPLAKISGNDSRNGQPQFNLLTSQTESRLEWRKLRIGGDENGPATTSPVWLPPRKVRAANVSIDTGDERESERYLFYRGVGHFDAPLRTTIDWSTNRLTVYANFRDVAKDDESLSLGPMWLVHVRADGTSAFRTLDAGRATRNPAAVVGRSPVQFAESEFHAENLTKLRDQMHAALMADGLLDDEATAMLETWQKAYFQSAGLRLFCLVPQVWTDDRLPLRLSRQAEIRRVMVARIEMISPQQRRTLTELSQAKISKPQWLYTIPRNERTGRFFDGHSDFGDLGVTVPADYQLYLQLGRFRNALLIAEEKARPSKSLTEFINNYNLYQFRVEE